MSNATLERVDVAGLVLTGQAFAKAVTVLSDVLGVPGSQSLDDRVNRIDAEMRIACVGRGKVGVHSSAVPVAFQRFVIERDAYVVLLADTIQQVTCNPHIVTNSQGAARFSINTTIANLKLPLTRHDFCIDAVEKNARGHACPGMRLDDLPAEGVLTTGTALILTLLSGKSVLGKTERTSVAEHGVFLLKTQPGINSLSGDVDHCAKLCAAI